MTRFARSNGKPKAKAKKPVYDGLKHIMSALDSAVEANKSDPFFRNRALTHIKNGLCNPRTIDGDYHSRGMSAHYTSSQRP